MEDSQIFYLLGKAPSNRTFLELEEQCYNMEQLNFKIFAF